MTAMESTLGRCGSISHLLDDDCLVPTDVAFSIPENSGSTIIKAHKLILACSSSVFEKMLYGALKEKDNVAILIEDATKHAFNTMIDFLYNKDVIWNDMDMEQLFNITYVAEKYDIALLKKEVIEKVNKYPLSQSKVMEIASLGFKYKLLDVSERLLCRCSEFLGTSLKDKKDILKFAAEYSETNEMETAFKLLAMMNKIEDAVCDNCQSSPCKNNQPLSDVNKVRDGLKIKTTNKPDIWGASWTNKNIEIVGYTAPNWYVLKQEGAADLSGQFNGLHTYMLYNCNK